MIVNFNELLYALSFALDCVEAELIGVSTGHSKRVAYLSVLLGEKMGLTKKELLDLAACAVLHDNALTQYISEEYSNKKEIEYRSRLEKYIETVEHDYSMTTMEYGIESQYDKLKLHCVYGEKNIKNFPFQTDVTGAILYHHERPDGKGPFRMPSSEVCLFAKLIHFADSLDAFCHLDQISTDQYQMVKQYLIEQINQTFEEEHVKIFLEVFPNEKAFDILKNNNMHTVLVQKLPLAEYTYESSQLREVALIFAQIIDYKSKFTMKHSIGIAEKAERMGKFYGYSKEILDKLYIAGALHDLGKLAIHNRVLEKPDKLTAEEYRYIQNHAYVTYQILKDIKGFEDICSWASNHHEKLNGKGYPFGKTAEQLGHLERLFACLDVYQALSEKRPYKELMSHLDAMQILNKMVDNGHLDPEITKDIGIVFSS